MSRPERSLPPGLDEPVFAEPWQAEAFSLTVALHQKGVFGWSEWADALSAEVHAEGARQDGSDYYVHWLAALEKLLAGKGVAATAQIDGVAAAWQRAAQATAHGQPIELANDPEKKRG